MTKYIYLMRRGFEKKSHLESGGRFENFSVGVFTSKKLALKNYVQSFDVCKGFNSIDVNQIYSLTEEIIFWQDFDCYSTDGNLCTMRVIIDKVKINEVYY